MRATVGRNILAPEELTERAFAILELRRSSLRRLVRRASCMWVWGSSGNSVAARLSSRTASAFFRAPASLYEKQREELLSG